MPEITTDKKIQNEIIRYYSAALEEQKIQIIKSSRGGAHLRFSYAGDAAKLLNSIFPCKLKPSDVSISGSYVTQELTLEKPLASAKKGDKIYVIVAVRSKGVLRTKQLTPDSLGFGGKTIQKSKFLEEVKTAIQKSSVPDNIKAFLEDFLISSGQASPKLKSNHVEGISDSDIAIVLKDFGELTGAWWYMSNTPGITAIEYPSASNQRLVDYYALKGKKKIAISAKAKEGAPPSIDAIADILKTMSYVSEPKKEGARKAVIAISENSTVDGIILAGKNLPSKAYTWLKQKIFKKDFTAQDCEKVLSSATNYKSVIEELKPFYSHIGRSASEDIAKRIFETKAKRFGLIISPMGYSLVDELNNNSDYIEVLNDAAKTIVVTQLYVNLNKSTKVIDYKIKEFANSSFKFEYNANAGQPSLKKISFKMNKK